MHLEVGAVGGDPWESLYQAFDYVSRPQEGHAVFFGGIQ